MSTIAPPASATTSRLDGATASRRVPRFLRGRPEDPAWVRPSLLGLLAATAVLYMWGLGASGWANAFYSAAAQAGSKSWTAFFFGSSDAANFITVDKAPAALWLMDLSGRIFGVNAWSILLPQALAGVASVGLLYATVRRAARPGAGLLAGLVLALTPVAALMFRFNNPDALLVLLLIGSAYATTRAVETGRTRWLVLAGALVGFGFLAKMLQSLLIVPAVGLTYLVAGPDAPLNRPRWPDDPLKGPLGPRPVLRRFAQLLAGAVAMVAAAGWWVAIVELVPASSRPYIGGSQDNSVWNLMFGYNGFGRLTGNEVGSVGGGGTGQGGRWGLTGLGRLANAEFGSQIAWLLPASLILLVAGLVISRRASRTNRTRAGLLLWGGWLVVTALTFSLGKGIIHPYYSVALAPPIGALIGIGGSLLWARRRDPVARSVLAATLALTSVWSYALLDRTPTWHPALRTLVAVAGVGLAVALLAVPHIGRWGSRAVAVGAVVVALAGPGAYSVATAATPHSGAIPSAGPAGAGGFGPGAGRGGPAGGAFTGGGAAGGNAAGGRGGIGGLLNGTTPTAALTAFLQQGSDRYTWVAATVGSNNAAGYQLATGDPVMAIGGFNGTDPAPTLAQFQADVAAGRIHFFLGGGGFGGGGAQGTGTTTVSTASQITAWVTSGFSSSTVGGTTVYDLTAPVG